MKAAHTQFARRYLETGNAAQSTLGTGYACVGEAHRLAHRPDVVEYLIGQLREISAAGAKSSNATARHLAITCGNGTLPVSHRVRCASRLARLIGYDWEGAE